MPIKLNLIGGSLVTLPLFLAREMRYFEKAGLDVQPLTTNNGNSATQLLSSGQLDIAISTIPVTIAANSSGGDLVIASGGETREPLALQCRKGVGAVPGYPAGISSLAGKSIGTTAPGGAPDIYTRALLVSAGVDPARVSWVTVGSVPAEIAAIKAKRIDCVTSVQPVQQQLAGDVDTIVDVQNGQGPEFLLNANAWVYLASKQFANANPEVINRFRSAITATNAFLSDPANAPAIAKAVAPDYPGVGEPDLTGLIRGLAPSFAGAENITASQFDDAVKAYNLAYGKNVTAHQSELVLK
ncbi:ABC transporter substrate-binding protein [Amycolatopsis pithecellobii]|uniref:ABC transporter substrate-binding protein n=1 Tax=Amycolatopsis pithecellobii TaxID=664692 RepID=UPI00140905FF|nr:ABC transporter substrate-binding protein [Amycolatopsis pithecellobii]